ncbi:MAG: hemerythrin domain-containing protein [Bacteroidales bacterium]|nr:hemerythrin domain-containing protein [Bacteroidales bacterium]
MKEKVFTEKMKMADVIAANHNVIMLLTRFGIPLGFGEKSVMEVCAANGVPVDFMLLICNVYTFNDYLPDIDELSTTDMSMLVPYLKASHKYYMHERLPHIEVHLHHIADKVGGRCGDILKRFYSDFRTEIEEHFRCEEENDFPNLERMQRGERVSASTATHFEKSHGGLVDKMNDLTQIVYKYLPGNELPEETMELIFDILQLSADIQKHALIEEKILIPYVEWMERSMK